MMEARLRTNLRDGGSSSTIEQVLARLAISDLPDSVTDDVRNAAKVQVVDCIGVTLAASTHEAGSVIRRTVDLLGEAPHASVLGHQLSSSLTTAAWANSSMAHLLDFDDVGFSHPTSCIYPAALAIAEWSSATGSEFLEAMIVGYEVFERLASSARASEPTARSRGFHPTSIYGAPAAAAAAGRLMGLNEDQMVVALGLAAAGAFGLSQQFGTWAKGVNAGNAARSGTTSALMAHSGFWGDEQGVTGRYGLLTAVHGPGNYDFSTHMDDVGERWSILDPGLAIKPHPACGSTLRAIDAMIRLRSTLDLHAEDIKEIEVHVHPDIFHTLRFREVDRGFRGKFSLNYTVAAAALDGKVDIETFSDESAQRPGFVRMYERVTLIEHPEWSMARKRHMPVRVVLKDGSSGQDSVDSPKGSREWPLTDEERDQKFLNCVAGAIGDRAPKALDALSVLDSDIEISEILASSGIQ